MEMREGIRRGEEVFEAAIKIHDRVRSNLGPAIVAAQAISDALKTGHKLLVFGNGGSAADAQHVAGELVGRFARQVEALGRPGDVALGISTSGESPNVVAALQTARAKGLKTVALTGRDGGSVGRAAEIHVNVPDQNTQRVQEVHMTLLHVMCEVIEEDANA